MLVVPNPSSWRGPGPTERVGLTEMSKPPILAGSALPPPLGRWQCQSVVTTAMCGPQPRLAGQPKRQRQSRVQQLVSLLTARANRNPACCAAPHCPLHLRLSRMPCAPGKCECVAGAACACPADCECKSSCCKTDGCGAASGGTCQCGASCACGSKCACKVCVYQGVLGKRRAPPHTDNSPA